MNKKGLTTQGVIVSILLVIFAAGTVFFGSYYFVGRIMDSQKKATAPAVDLGEMDAGISSLTADELRDVQVTSDVVTGQDDIIQKGMIKWQEPSDVGDLGLTSKKLYIGCKNDECSKDNADISSNGIKYFKVGTIITGKYTGAEVVIISSNVSEGPSITPVFYYVLKTGSDFIFLTRDYDEYTSNFVKANFFAGAGKKIINSTAVIEELNYPDEFQISDRQSFTKEPYNNYFFHAVGIKPAFVHPELGQVWITDDNADFGYKEDFELNSFINAYDGIKMYEDFEVEGFYLKAPDGTVVVYKLKLEIFDKQERYALLQATWNDGQKNTEEYEIAPSGCGSSDYVYNETLDVDIDNQLVVVGTTDKGDNLYGYKDTTHEGFQKLYDEIYWVKDGEKKKNQADFLKINPKVFWVDPFGRTLAFYRADIISPAECGKPVIYLYPEKPMAVNVQVKPGNGLNVSIPEYGDGWNVFADTESNITNTKDGKTYPYLFWEGQGKVPYVTPSVGFVVAKSGLNMFFDEKLGQLGLIGKEIEDFKEFWLPEMTKNDKPYYFVTFLSKRFMDLNAPLTISPSPDTVIRVMMDYKELDQYRDVAELKISAPERKGFTAVEWGGMLK